MTDPGILTVYGSAGPPASTPTVCSYCGKTTVYPHKEPDTNHVWQTVNICTSGWRAN